jgi:FMN phosphatase YigB (HAD superfamily)
MIGDDWDVDVLGAVKFGIDAIYYSKNSSNANNFNLNLIKTCKIYSIEQISQLRSFL